MRKQRERLRPVALLVAGLMAMAVGMSPAGAQTTRSCDEIFTQLDLVLDAEDAVFELPPGFARDTQLANLEAIADRLFDEAEANGCLDDDDGEPIGPDYVALGDSYASGEGNAPYDPDTNSLDSDFPQLTNLCHRSVQGSYPEYLADTEDLSLTNVTCSGAITFDIYSSNQRNFNEPPQVNAITSETDLVTITIGGNDVGFDDILNECVRGNQTYDRGGGTVARSDCRSSKGAQTFALIDRFLSSNSLLGKAYDKVNERIADVGANARVFVVGYPQLFNNLDGGNDRFPACGAVANVPSGAGSPGITRREMGFLYDAVHAANEAIKVVAEEKGFTFVDVEDAFGEEGAVCGSDPLVRGVSLGFDPRLPGLNPLDRVVVSSSFHPTADGQALIAAHVAAEVFG